MRDPLLKIAYAIRKEMVALHSEESLDGCCLIASSSIVHEAKRAKIKARVVTGYYCDKRMGQYSHAWVEDANRIIDATATQFGVRNKVLVTSKDDPRYTRRGW